MSPTFSPWFAGPKAENAEAFERTLTRIAQDYYAWRRNYFPEDGTVLDHSDRRSGEDFRDAFDDRLIELLGRLKADFPFHSPRYAAHMVSEQTLPSIAGYFAAMLYNPNNVSRDAAPVTVALENEACRMLADMIGYGPGAWGHLTGGGTVANLEALWVARTVAYLPYATAEIAATLGLAEEPLPKTPAASLAQFSALFDQAKVAQIPLKEVLEAYATSRFCVAERGMASVVNSDGREPVILAPESHHYCFEKALDVLGLGRQALVSIPVDANFRLNVAALEERLSICDAGGQHVLAVVAVVGSTEEGAVDPLDEIVALRDRRIADGRSGFWLHVDGAYGGYLRTMTRPARIGLGEPSVETRLMGKIARLSLELPIHGACTALECMGEADSVTIDPHKLGFVPYPAGAVCFRSDLVKPILRQRAPYLEDDPSDPTAERGSDAIGVYILEGSKPGAAAAAVWLSHKLIPLDGTGHGALVKETVRNACELHALLEMLGREPGRTVYAESLCPPGSNILCFAFRANEPRSLRDLNDFNRRIYERFTVEDGGRVYDQRFFLSRTTLDPAQYGQDAVGPFLSRLGVSKNEYDENGVFLLRSVLMNPWYQVAKRRSRHYLAEMAEELYRIAGRNLEG